MKKSLRIIIAALLLTGFSTQAWAQRNFYWVVGAGDWNTPANWRVGPASAPANLYVDNATAMGYSSTLTVPTAADDVYFSSSLFTRLITGRQQSIITPESRIVTVPAGATARNIDFSGSLNIPTFQITGPFSVTGSLIFGATAVSSPVIVTNSGALSVGGSVTYGTNSGGSSLTVSGPATLSNSLTVNAPVAITANNALSVAGSIAYGGTAGGSSSLNVTGPLSIGTNLAVNAPAVITVTGALTVPGSVSFSTSAGNSSLTVGGMATIGSALTVNSATAIVPNGGLLVGGSVTVTSTGASLALNGPTTIGGSFNLAAAGNITGTTGSLTFTSTTASTIDAKGATIGVPVTFNGVGGRWILQSNLTIGNRANFVNGYVIALPAPIASDPARYNEALPPTETTTAVNSPMMLFTTSTTVSARAEGASNASHVVGYVRKLSADKTNMPMPQQFVFPIGNGTHYRPITMYDPSNSGGDFTARYVSANPYRPVPSVWKTLDYLAPLNSVSDREFWYFTATGSASTNFSLNYMHPEESVRNHYRIDKWQGMTIAGLSVSTSGNAEWSDMGGIPTNVTNGTIPSLAGTSSSRVWFTIARRGSTPQPVSLVSFTGQQLDGQVQLKWQSSEEKNTSHFEVERSADGKNFSQVLTKKAQGNSASLVSYNAIDNSPLAGTSYYRLKMVDLDGTFEYSKLVAVSAEGTLLAKAYPNPSKGNGVNIIAGDGSKLVLKAVSDLFGKQVGYQAGSSSAEGLQINFTQPLPAGFYVATLAGSDNGQLVKVKFVVQ